MHSRVVGLIVCVVAFSSCGKKPEGTEVSPEAAALLRRVQQENGLDDDRLRKSLDQWVKFNATISEITGSGEITAEELKEAVLASKDAVKAINEKSSIGELMNVALLDGLLSGKEAEMKDYLRQDVVKAYRKAELQRSNPLNASLIEKIEALRKKDVLLDEMIRREVTEEDVR